MRVTRVMRVIWVRVVQVVRVVRVRVRVIWVMRVIATVRLRGCNLISGPIVEHKQQASNTQATVSNT